MKEITLASFIREVKGHTRQWSLIYLLGVTIEQVIDALNSLSQSIPLEAIGGGGMTAAGDAVFFEIDIETPDIIHLLTEKLHCRGYGCMDWDVQIFEASENGSAFDDFIVEWQPGSPSFEDDEWSCLLNVIDPSGFSMEIGCAGAIDDAETEFYYDLVNKYNKKRKE